MLITLQLNMLNKEIRDQDDHINKIKNAIKVKVCKKEREKKKYMYC